jgi:hypothetical protein
VRAEVTGKEQGRGCWCSLRATKGVWPCVRGRGASCWPTVRWGAEARKPSGGPKVALRRVLGERSGRLRLSARGGEREGLFAQGATCGRRLIVWGGSECPLRATEVGAFGSVSGEAVSLVWPNWRCGMWDAVQLLPVLGWLLVALEEWSGGGSCWFELHNDDDWRPPSWRRAAHVGSAGQAGRARGLSTARPERRAAGQQLRL